MAGEGLTLGAAQGFWYVLGTLDLLHWVLVAGLRGAGSARDPPGWGVMSAPAVPWGDAVWVVPTCGHSWHCPSRSWALSVRFSLAVLPPACCEPGSRWFQCLMLHFSHLSNRDNILITSESGRVICICCVSALAARSLLTLRT